MMKTYAKRSRVGLWVMLALVVILLGAVGAGILLDPLDCRIAQGVTIGGLDLGGLTWNQARKALDAAVEETILRHDLVVELPREIMEISLESVDLKVSVLDAVNDAYWIGRKTENKPQALPLSDYISLDQEAVRSSLQAYAVHHDTTLTQPEWKLRGQVPELGTDVFDPAAPGQTVELTLGLPEQRLDVDGTVTAVLEAYDRGLQGEYTLTIEIPATKLPDAPDLEKIYATCKVAPKDDSLDMNTHAQIFGTYGYHFDMEKARELVDQAAYGETISIPMEPVEPEIFGEGVYFRDVLGTCETKHTNDENRNTNLQLLCQFLDGMVIQPGEAFSYNAAVGERTPERGFKPATAYSGNRMTKDYGGGVCQGSTTLYNCLLQADMEITARYGHGALVSYIPLGLDAAVNWSTNTDLAFVNNSHFPVKISAELSDGYMKMKLLGTDEKDYYIEMEASSYQEGDYYYAVSYKCKYDKQTKELISRDRVAFSTYVAKLEG